MTANEAQFGREPGREWEDWFPGGTRAAKTALMASRKNPRDRGNV
jgi:hypothetical protein